MFREIREILHAAAATALADTVGLIALAALMIGALHLPLLV